jgi:hypothetical protein
MTADDPYTGVADEVREQAVLAGLARADKLAGS